MTEPERLRPRDAVDWSLIGPMMAPDTADTGGWPSRILALVRRSRVWPAVGRGAAWIALASLGAGAIWYSLVADLREWLEHIGGLLSPLAIVWGVQRYLAAARRRSDEELKSRHYRAWQTINSAQGKPGSGGRIDALQELATDGVSLAGVNLDGAYLAGLKAPGANLAEASLRSSNGQSVVLTGAHLKGATLVRAHLESALLLAADLEGAVLFQAHLEGANLFGARLERAILGFASLEGASLVEARLEYAKCTGADFKGAVLERAHLERSVLCEVHFEGAVLTEAHLEDANLSGISWDENTVVRNANISGVTDAPAGFREWALGQGALETLPAVGLVQNSSDDQ